MLDLKMMSMRIQKIESRDFLVLGQWAMVEGNLHTFYLIPGPNGNFLTNRATVLKHEKVEQGSCLTANMLYRIINRPWAEDNLQCCRLNADLIGSHRT